MPLLYNLIGNNKLSFALAVLLVGGIGWLALAIARSVHQSEQPELTIRFGSRTRGDWRDRHFDIDIMIIADPPPTGEEKRCCRPCWPPAPGRKPCCRPPWPC